MTTDRGPCAKCGHPYNSHGVRMKLHYGGVDEVECVECPIGCGSHDFNQVDAK